MNAIVIFSNNNSMPVLIEEQLEEATHHQISSATKFQLLSDWIFLNRKKGIFGWMSVNRKKQPLKLIARVINLPLGESCFASPGDIVRWVSLSVSITLIFVLLVLILVEKVFFYSRP